MRGTLVVFLALLVFLPSAFPASVTPLTDRLPRPIVGAVGVFVDGQSYVLGGRVADGTYVDTILRAVPGSGAEVIGTIPAGPGERPGRYAGAAVVLDGMIYYFGGATLKETTVSDGTPTGTTQAYVPTASADILRIDPATGTATILPATEKLKRAAFGMSAVAYKGKAYVFGGFYFDYSDISGIDRLDTITVYDPHAEVDDRVRLLPAALPFAVQDASAAVLGSRVYLMGGLSDNDNTTNRCEPEPNWSEACLTDRIVTWSPDVEGAPPRVVGTLPYRAQWMNTAVVGGKAYLISGLLNDATASTSIIEVATSGDTGNVATRVLFPTLSQGLFGAATTTDGRNVTLYGGRIDRRDDVLIDTILKVEPGATAPWAPRNVTATSGSRGVHISWEPPRYDGETVVSAYNVYRATGGENGTYIGTTNNLAYDDATVCPGVESLWRVAAVNARGESESGSIVAFTPASAAPSAPTNVTAFGGNAEVIVRWQPPGGSCDVVVSGYAVLRDGLEIARIGPQLEYRDVNNIVNGRVYNYQLRAYNAQGSGPVSEGARAVPAEVPSAPRSVIASALNSSVQLTWSAPPEAVAHYLVNRSTTPGAQGEVVGNVSTTTFTDPTVERGRTYFYTVRAVNPAGRSPPSEIVAASLVRKPGPPTDVTALGLPGEVLVTWQRPVDTGDAPAAAIRYFVTRSGGGTSNPIIVKTDIDALAFHDRNVTSGQAYTYSVTTLNPRSSAPSEEATATPLPSSNRQPTAALTAFPSVVLADEPIEFDASRSADPDGTIREYVYDFGDGTDVARTAASGVTHTYHANGTYTATLVVQDNKGNLSEPANVRVVVGAIAPTSAPDTTGGLGSPTGSPTSRPGTDTPESPVPGPQLGALLAGALVVALAMRRQR